MATAQQWIDLLGMISHPEGGYYKETYSSTEEIPAEALPERFGVTHCFGTAIYFLLQQGDFSALHRINQDEIWHFYAGDGLTIHQIRPDGSHCARPLGCDPACNAFPQLIVPAGHYFGAEVIENGAFALVGCTVSPGFLFSDFIMPSREKLLEMFPQHREVIVRLSR